MLYAYIVFYVLSCNGRSYSSRGAALLLFDVAFRQVRSSDLVVNIRPRFSAYSFNYFAVA